MNVFKTLALFLLFMILATGNLCHAEAPAKPVGSEIASSLSDAAPVLVMYGETLDWGTLKKLMVRDGMTLQKNHTGNYFASPVKDYLQSVARMAVSLHLAREGKMELSDGDRAKYLEMIRKELENDQEKTSFEAFVKRYPKETQSIFEPCLADVLLLTKYNDECIRDLTVTDEDVASYKRNAMVRQLAVTKFNKAQRRLLDELLDKGTVSTDEGFAEAAKKYSEGKEAPEGGLLGEYPRWLVASACELESFDYKAGQTSSVIVTKQAFRLMRVLSVKVPEKEGEDELVKVAQILLTRYPEQEVGNDEAIRRGLLNEKQLKALKERLLKGVMASGMMCPLFPRGLFEKDEK